MDIIICRIRYPNDPTGNLDPHQHFIGLFDSKQIVLYSISSLRDKENRVYQADESLHPNYFKFSYDEQKECNLRQESFINCSTSFRLTLTPDMDITKLAHRTMPPEIKERLLEKIEEVKQANRHKEYPLSTEEFIKHNPRVKKNILKMRR